MVFTTEIFVFKISVNEIFLINKISKVSDDTLVLRRAQKTQYLRKG